MKRKIAIVGLGETGLACVDFFVSQNIPVFVIDSRDNPPKSKECETKYPSVPIYTGGFPKEILYSAETIVLSPGISKHHPDLLKNISEKAEMIGEIELFARHIQKPIPKIAITGSNGKSTVTTLVGEMAKASKMNVAVGGNLGTPAITLLNQNPELYVLELSSFQLETTDSLKPTVATILNICPDHLDYHASEEAYVAAKLRIYKDCEKIVYNRQDVALTQVLIKHFTRDVFNTIPKISFGLDEPAEDQYGLLKDKHNPQELMIARGKEALLPISKIGLFGRHNVANVLAALALGESIHLPLSAMLSAVENFKGLPHRCEWVRELEGVQWINDSKGTNVGATVAALQGLSKDISGKWVIILGGLGKNADFSPLKPVIMEHCRSAILIGQAKDELADLLRPDVACVSATSLQEAVAMATKMTLPGDGVLLSPACASYDMFKNYEERGNVFKQATLSL